MSEWKECKLGEVCYQITDGKHGDCVTEENSGFFFLSAKDVRDGKLLYENARQITKTDFEETHRRTNLKPGDILITNSGTIGRMAIAPLDDKTYKTTFQKSVAIIKPITAIIVNDFCYYRLLADFSRLVDLAGGTTQQNLLLGDLREHLISFPPLPEQRAITGVLSSLDDKIDLLHRQNKTLEGMAEVVYRHFFVDNRKATWQECTVSKLADHEKTSIHPNRNPDTPFYHYSIPAFDESHMPTRELGALIQSNKYKVIKNTILFSKLNPHKDKRVWLIPSSIAENSVCSTEFQVMNPKAEKYLFFLYGFIGHPENYDEIAAGVGGTSGSHQRIDPEVIFKFMCFLPDDRTLINYNEMVEPIFGKMRHNRKSIQTLIHHRDLLLPKLISGEVRVKV